MRKLIFTTKIIITLLINRCNGGGALFHFQPILSKKLIHCVFPLSYLPSCFLSPPPPPPPCPPPPPPSPPPPPQTTLEETSVELTSCLAQWREFEATEEAVDNNLHDFEAASREIQLGKNLAEKKLQLDKLKSNTVVAIAIGVVIH